MKLEMHLFFCGMLEKQMYFQFHVSFPTLVQQGETFEM